MMGWALIFYGSTGRESCWAQRTARGASRRAGRRTPSAASRGSSAIAAPRCVPRLRRQWRTHNLLYMSGCSLLGVLLHKAFDNGF